MKRFSLVIFALSLLTALFAAGCGSSDDGPSFSDDELLKRGSGGHNAASSGSKTTAPPQSGQ